MGESIDVILGNAAVTSYLYDGAGNRIFKHVFEDGVQKKATAHVRDASGNVMQTAITKVDSVGSGTTSWEYPLYGSSRLGMYRGGTDKLHRMLGNKQYELSNHLGNVLAVVSDAKVGEDSTGDGSNNYYLPHVVSLSDYYPFGLEMPDRTLKSNEYRYGFNGQEIDNDIYKGSLSFKYRIHNPAIGRFLSVDPLEKDYPWNSTYAFAENRVIQGGDLEGREFDQFTVYKIYLSEAKPELAKGADKGYIYGFLRATTVSGMKDRVLENGIVEFQTKVKPDPQKYAIEYLQEKYAWVSGVGLGKYLYEMGEGIYKGFSSDNKQVQAETAGDVVIFLATLKGTLTKPKVNAQLPEVIQLTDYEMLVVSELEGVTATSTEVANYIREGRMSIHVIEDEIMNRLQGENTIAATDNHNVFIRESRQHLFGDSVHEGVHVIDHLTEYNKIVGSRSVNPWVYEYRAFNAQIEFAIIKGEPTPPRTPNIGATLDNIDATYKAKAKR